MLKAVPNLSAERGKSAVNLKGNIRKGCLQKRTWNNEFVKGSLKSLAQKRMHVFLKMHTVFGGA